MTSTPENLSDSPDLIEPDLIESVVAEDGAAAEQGAAEQPVGRPVRPRASRRIPRSDAVLEAAVDQARAGVLEVAPEAQVGRHVSAVIEGERLVTHRFEAFVPGYGGWQWYSTVARVSRGKAATVCEVGLLPSASSLVAPPWLPWAERVRPEDSQTDDQQTGEQPDEQGMPGGVPDTTDDAADRPAAT